MITLGRLQNKTQTNLNKKFKDNGSATKGAFFFGEYLHNK